MQRASRRIRHPVVTSFVLAGLLALPGWVAPTASAQEAAPIVPFALVPLAADAGYFLAQGSCPARTSRIRYEWSGASNGNGLGQTRAKSGPFSIALRMVAASPGGAISVRVTCIEPNGKRTLEFGPVDVASGADLLALPANSGTGRRIVYSLSAQQLWAVEPDGIVARTHLVSGCRLPLESGRRQTGVFMVDEKRPFGCRRGCPKFLVFRYTSGGVIGFHEIPFNRNGPLQIDAELGQPRSHGCIRQSAADADWLYNWAVRGDPVIVID